VVPVKIPPPMLLKSAAKPQDVDGKSYDLVVIGGTPGGIACAVRAAREGLSVLLVNHTQHLGGFVTSGAGGWEAPYDGLRSPIYGEMITGAAQYYAKTYGEGSPQHIASMPSKTSRAHIDRPKIEPRIAEMLFNRDGREGEDADRAARPHRHESGARWRFDQKRHAQADAWREARSRSAARFSPMACMKAI
jgi:flavin-dependent dehydrogenase